MKPDWKDAPSWANWLCQDSDGGYYWFEDEPQLYDADGTEVWMTPDESKILGVWIGPTKEQRR